MKVKVKNKIYDSEKEPIMVILSDSDKKNIKNMLSHCTKYACFPDKLKYTESEMIQWMATNQ